MSSEGNTLLPKQEMDVEQYNQKLQKHVTQLENDLRLAAEIGKQLLTTNQDLTQQIENTAREYTKKIECLEQERHEGQLWKEQKIQQDKDRDEEIEYLRTRYDSQQKHFQMREQAEHVTAINQLKKQNTASSDCAQDQLVTLQAELEEATLTTSQMEQKARECEQHAESLQSQLTDCINVMNETCSEEMGQLHSEVNTLSALKRELEAQVSDSHREIQQLKLSLARAQGEVSTLRTEMEEQQCQATSYFNALERSREEVQELKAELDIIRMETQDQKRKGNSLFGEVEDRRVEAEKRMIALKVQNDTLRKQYSMTKENLNKFKLQMAALLQMSTGRADAQHVERLQEQLYEALSEVDGLTKKLALHTTVKAPMEGMESWEKLLNQHGNEFAQYVKAILKKKDEEMARVQEDASTQHLQLMSRTQRVLEYERRVYSLEQEKERLLGLSMKQRMRIDELTIKYEPDKHKAAHLPTLKAEKLPLNAYRNGRLEAPPAENKENHPRPPPRPLDVPDHIKAVLHGEVIRETAPSATTTTSPDVFHVSCAQDTRSTAAPSLASIQGKPVKKASFSDVVDVVEIEATPRGDDPVEQGQGTRRVKGSKLVADKVTKVKAASKQDVEECMVQ